MSCSATCSGVEHFDIQGGSQKLDTFHKKENKGKYFNAYEVYIIT